MQSQKKPSKFMAMILTVAAMCSLITSLLLLLLLLRGSAGGELLAFVLLASALLVVAAIGNWAVYFRRWVDFEIERRRRSTTAADTRLSSGSGLAGTMFTLLERLKAIKRRIDRYPLTWVELDDEGFAVKTERWPFPAFEKWVYWEEVNEIHAFLKDCFSYHAVGLLFDGPWKRPVMIYEDQKGWDSLVAEIEKQCAGFNRHNFCEVERFFPGEACLPCWDKTKVIGDLELREAEKRVVWTQDGSIFQQWQ